MKNIIPVSKISTLKNQKGKIVLVGGCFDILHLGHIIFLEKAKRVGDTLVVFLESDRKVKLLKGKNRPIHTQKERAQVLSALKYVDFVVLLPFMKDQEYDQLILKLKPDMIATTLGSDNAHKVRVAKLVGAKLKYVTGFIESYSTSRILKKE